MDVRTEIIFAGSEEDLNSLKEKLSSSEYDCVIGRHLRFDFKDSSFRSFLKIGNDHYDKKHPYYALKIARLCLPNDCFISISIRSKDFIPLKFLKRISSDFKEVIGIGIGEELNESKLITLFFGTASTKTIRSNGYSTYRLLKHAEIRKRALDNRMISYRAMYVVLYSIYVGSQFERDVIKEIDRSNDLFYRFYLSVLYYKTTKKVFSYCLEAANKGFVLAKFSIASFYIYGKGTEKNIEEGRKWYLEAIRNCNVEIIIENFSRNELMCLALSLNQSNEKNFSNAIFDYLIKDQEMAVELANIFLGNREGISLGVNPSSEKAISILEKGRNCGDLSAAMKLSRIYHSGNIIEADNRKAFDNALFASYLENKKSCCTIFVNGKQVNNLPNYRYKGEPSFMVAECYEKGIGVDKNLYRARTYYSLAASLKNEKANNRLVKLNKALGDSSDSIDEEKHTLFEDGVVAIMQKDFDNAKEFLSKALELNNSKERLLEINSISDEKTYSRAISWMNSGKSRKAAEAFKSIVDWKDSREKYYQALSMYAPQIYQESIEHYTKRSFDKALEGFSTITDWEDVKEYIYSIAMAFLDEKSFDKAINCFERIIDWKDSSAKINTAKDFLYENALSLIENGENDSAIAELSKIINWRDSAEKIRLAIDTKVYKIGDTGPAGGTVIFDKGNSEGGWRFIEAASKCSTDRMIWGSSDQCETKTEIGFGKYNTESIVKVNGTSPSAALLCKDYSDNGYDSWCLPSKDELMCLVEVLGINDDQTSLWSSSKDGDTNQVWYYGYSSKGMKKCTPGKYYSFFVWPIRYF